MELRKDPITQSWVILGQREVVAETAEQCPLEPEKIEKVPAIMIWPAAGPWQVRVVPHPDPLYHVESDPGRLAEGMYDKMGALGAHEVVVETPQHDRRLSLFSDEEIERVRWEWAWGHSSPASAPWFLNTLIYLNRTSFFRSAMREAHTQSTRSISSSLNRDNRLSCCGVSTTTSWAPSAPILSYIPSANRPGSLST